MYRRGISEKGLAAIINAARSPVVRLVSTDLFDTVLLRDGSLQSLRFAEAARVASARLGVAPQMLTQIRGMMHEDAYRAVATAGHAGEASLEAISVAMALALGLNSAAARLLSETEIAVDIRHLSPNRRLLAILASIATSGTRIVALSDSYYSGAALQRIVSAVIGDTPLGAIYSSSDLGLAKHSGGAFGAVAAREGLEAHEILHIGDDKHADVIMARQAGWQAVHIRRRPSALRIRQIVSAAATLFGVQFDDASARGRP